MFLFPALTIGFLFVAVPPLVHLINMLRHRRQSWAAMDFLMASYRKQRRWILLRQLLLLLVRAVLAGLLIAMLCGWTGGRQILGTLGGKTTHHVFLLDDSYSMGDTSGGSTAYDRGLDALQTLAERLAEGEGSVLTVIRASRAAMATRGGGESGDVAADVAVQSVLSDTRLVAGVMGTRPAPVRTDLVPAIDLVAGMVSSAVVDETVVYVASDFRRGDWGAADRIAESMRQLETPEIRFRMIDCAASPTPNLAVESLRAEPDVWVAGVPVTMKVRVKNHANSPRKDVVLKVQTVQYDESIGGVDPTRRFSGEPVALPAVTIDSIPAGETVNREFQVYIARPGTHVVEVSLPEDAVRRDNRRVCTLPLSGAERVLIVDGSDDQRGAFHLASVLDPGSQVRIGATPEIQPLAFLRSVTMETLARYRAVYLVDVPEVSSSTAATLHRYVSSGGGLAWFLGSGIDRDAYNRVLLEEGRQLLPRPLDRIVPLEPTPDSVAGDVLLGDPTRLLRPIRSGGNPLLALVGVARAWSLVEEEPAEATRPTATSASTTTRVDVPLKLRNGRPLVTEHRCGGGQVITVLSGLQSDWTNWPRDPTFVVFVLQTNAVLWSGATPPTSESNLTPTSTGIAANDFAPTVRLFAPATAPRVGVDRVAESVDGESPMLRAAADPLAMASTGDEGYVDFIEPGIAEWQLTRLDGPTVVVPVARVMELGEGDLERVNRNDLRRDLRPLEVEFVSSGQWSEANRTAGSSTASLILVGLFVLFFAIEQVLAYWASYHAAGRSGGRASRADRHAGGLPPLRGHRKHAPVDAAHRGNGRAAGNASDPGDSGSAAPDAWPESRSATDRAPDASSAEIRHQRTEAEQ